MTGTNVLQNEEEHSNADTKYDVLITHNWALKTTQKADAANLLRLQTKWPTWRPSVMESPWIFTYTLYFYTLESLDYIVPPKVSIYLRWHFSGGLRKTVLFLQEWRFSRSRSSKVIEFGTNRKCVFSFLLICNTNLGLILHLFGDFAALMCSWCHLYSTVILGAFPLHQIAHVVVNKRISPKPFGGEITFDVFQPMWSRCLKLRQADRRTTCNLITVRCYAERGNEIAINILQCNIVRQTVLGGLTIYLLVADFP